MASRGNCARTFSLAFELRPGATGGPVEDLDRLLQTRCIASEIPSWSPTGREKVWQPKPHRPANLNQGLTNTHPACAAETSADEAGAGFSSNTAEMQAATRKAAQIAAGTLAR